MVIKKVKLVNHETTNYETKNMNTIGNCFLYKIT